MKKIIKACKGFIKSTFGGVIFLFVKLLSIVNKKPPHREEYINLNENSDGDTKKPPPPPKPKTTDKPSQGGSLGVSDK